MEAQRSEKAALENTEMQQNFDSVRRDKKRLRKQRNKTAEGACKGKEKRTVHIIEWPTCRNFAQQMAKGPVDVER